MEVNNILLTFDYELFQGKRSGTVENCLLKPTRAVLDILQRQNTTAVFFIDMLYLCRLHEASAQHSKAKADFDLIEKQIIEMAERGHYVFNHLHTHWLDAVYIPEDNQWELTDTSKYSFHSLSENERAFAFDKTMKLLNKILKKASKMFSPDAFRAGGLYIQPFATFDPHFTRHGLKYDFSVLIGAKGKLADGAGSFDFTSVHKSIYKFENEVARENANGAFTEYALKFAEITFGRRILNSAFYRIFSRTKNHQRYGDGTPTSNKIITPGKGKFISLETFSLELLNDIKLPVYLDEVRNRNYLHLLSHPKLLSPYSLKVFDKLLKKLKQTGEVEFDFKKFKLQN